jgi:hypothetical protein
MILRLLCPSGHVLDVDAQLAGRKIRCGACGKIMVVPRPAKGPVQPPPARPPVRLATTPPAKPVVKPLAKPAAKPLTKAVPKPIAKPQAARAAKPIAKLPATSPAKKTTAEPPPATPPGLPREAAMVAVPLPPAVQPERAAAAVGEAIVARRRGAGFASPSWLGKLWPAAEKHLPADATIPGKAERRIALQLAAVPAAAAELSLLSVFGLGHANLLAAPPWALAAVLLAVVQLVYAVWMINAPDWVSAWVQMVVCAVVATIYGMLMTLTTITPVNHPLALGLGEVRPAAPGWCGLMLVLMGAGTWFCGRTSTRWKRRLMSPAATDAGD